MTKASCPYGVDSKETSAKRKPTTQRKGQYLLAHVNDSGGTSIKPKEVRFKHLLDPVTMRTSLTSPSLTVPESENLGGKPGGRVLKVLGRRVKSKRIMHYSWNGLNHL